jgi:cytochrome oxidase Cu insertion factor (SCO1/SenC/PrrC family)
MLKNKGNKLLLFALIVFGPFSLFYFFSTGKHNFQKLPYLGETQSDSLPFTYKGFSFIGNNHLLIDENFLKGKIIVFCNLYASCPYTCNISIGQFKTAVYKEVILNRKMKDVIFLSNILDASAPTDITNMHKRLEVDSSRWFFINDTTHFFYQVKMGGKVLTQKPDEQQPGKLFFERIVLLIDKNLHLRNIYDGARSTELVTLIKEIRLLKKEYHED